MENRIEVPMTSEKRMSILKGVQTLKKEMPFLVKLTEEEKKSLSKMDDHCKPFVRRCLELATKEESLNPGDGFVKEATLNLEFFEFLSEVEFQLNALQEYVAETKQMVGSDALDIARFIYLKARMNKRLGISGAEGSVSELYRLIQSHCLHTHLISVQP